MFAKTVITFVLFIVIAAKAASPADAFTSVLESLENGYDKRIRPNYGEAPVKVGSTVYILQLIDVNEMNPDYTMQLYFRQFWNDPRLAFNAAQLGTDKIVLDENVGAQKFWTPDSFFVNGVESNLRDPRTRDFFRIQSNGDVLWSQKIGVTATFLMDLRMFPFDTQILGLEIESFGYTMNDMVYEWKDGDKSVMIASEAGLITYNVMGVKSKTVSASLSTGNYSMISFEVQLARHSSYYVTVYYVPLCMMVILSWVSLWTDRREILARILLILLPLLFTALMSGTFQSSMPKVPYTKAIDVFSGIHVIFIFILLLHNATLNYLTKRSDMLKDRDLSGNEGLVSRAKKIVQEARASSMDKWGRIIFPLAYLIFIIIYFATYGC